MSQDLYEVTKDEFTMSTDKARLDFAVIHQFLTHSYWTPGIPEELVRKAAKNSQTFGLFHGPDQIGYGRVVTDCTSFAYLADVFVLPRYRGQGLGTWLVECIVACPLLQELRNFTLGTRDAHGLYERFGFKRAEDRSSTMVMAKQMPWYQPDLYP